uniref:RNA-binding motif protein, X-linked 2 n=1 Tax=Takifugu rubripes TaxID=31033 RepID=H2RUS8_TAKRU
MNPLTKVKLINQLNEREADLGVKETVSWHSEYKDSAWVFIGGFPYELSEGDIICVFSQYGEIVNINLVRDKKTGKSKGFCFLCYEDQRSTILAVDNFNGIKVVQFLKSTFKLTHYYRPPKDSEDIDDVTKILREEGCAPSAPAPSSSSSEENEQNPKKKKKEKKEKKRAKKETTREGRSARFSSPANCAPAVRVKEEKEDAAYDKYHHKAALSSGGQSNGQRAKANERLQDEREDRRKNQGKETEQRRQTDRDIDRRREADRERERDRNINRREGDMRREGDGEIDRRREGERERDIDRSREGDRERNRDKDKRREGDRGRETDRYREK